MKTSLAHEAKSPIDKPTAWACTVTNAVTLPGLGSLAAGRKVGYAQAACALIGFLLSFGGLLGHLRVWYATGEMPEGFTAGLVVAVLGMTLFGLAWLWALTSSIRLHRQATRPLPASNRDAVEVSTLPPRL